MFSISGIEIDSPEVGNTLTDSTRVIVNQMEDGTIETHIIYGQLVRRYTADIPQDVLEALLALVDQQVTVVFDTLVFDANMVIQPLTNDEDFVWSCDFTFYEV